MKFRFEDRLVDDYMLDGFVVLRNAIPPSLVADLRKISDKARMVARERGGPQAQRLQPLHDAGLDLAPIQAYAELAHIREALEKILGFEVSYGRADRMAILFEPAEMPSCTPWHRDWRDNARELTLARWERSFHDPELFNQINAPLYEDTCTWVVPGSHLRPDLAREHAAFPVRPTPEVDFDGLSYEERESLCANYCRSMPNGLRVVLNAGDFMVYRNTLWHLGSYLPYKIRATLHDTADTAKFEQWREEAALPLA